MNETGKSPAIKQLTFYAVKGGGVFVFGVFSASIYF